MGKAVDPKLLQKLIRFQLNLRRLQAGERRKVLNIFKVLGIDTIKTIGGDELGNLSKARLNKLLKDLEGPINEAYAALQQSTTDLNNVVAEVQLKAVNEALDVTGRIISGISMPTDATIARLSLDPLIKGGPLSDWWGKQRTDTTFKVTATIREGVLLGRNNQEIVRSLIGTPTAPGILTISRNQANSLVQTATHTIANETQQAVFNVNADIILSLKWFTALDSHVCPLCMARADKSWTNTPDRKPIGHDIPYQIPPIHFNDRCILIPEMQDLGVPVGERASSLGPIKGDITFKEYLKLVPDDQVEEMLGVGRAKLFNDGKVTLSQLISGDGRELTLQQLKEKYS